MAQSLNTKADFSTEGIAYLGFPVYGKILIGDVAFEFYDDRNVEKNTILPWTKISRVEGVISKSFGGKTSIARHFTVVIDSGSKLRFSSKDAGSVLKWMRQYLGDEKVVKAPTFLSALKRIFTRNK